MKQILFILGFLWATVSYSQCAYLTAGPDLQLDCTDPCTTITANFLPIRETSSYTVSSIPYAPVPYATGTIFPIAIDDRWSSVLTLPFSFCFYGQTYNSYLIGTNGVISFNQSYANLYCPWPFTLPIPNSNAIPPPGFPRPMIGLYHDIDPSLGGEVRYGIYGSYPCRRLVLSFFNASHHNCPIQRSTFQIILYEFTNIIEVHVERKQTCGSWNGGRACLGIQNAAGTVASFPVGRNTANYTINTPEAWRFTPSGPIISSFSWMNGFTGSSYTSCYGNDSTLVAQLSYNCGGIPFFLRDTVNVSVQQIPNQIFPIIHN
jgi:hypothetical protein